MPAMSLAMVSAGKKVKVKSIVGGFGIRQKLNALGLYEGTAVAIIKNDFRGPIILKVLESKIAIGRGQAQKIMVEVL